MSPETRRFLVWAPRVLTIMFAGFLAMFALDVFGQHMGLGDTLVALFMHLLPPLTVLAVLALAWNREWIGAVLFAVLGLAYLSKNLEHLSWTLVISCPLFVVSALFLLNWVFRHRLHTAT
jgi:hypothetical protein